jgi:DNA polymerase III subunit gamma/tau
MSDEESAADEMLTMLNNEVIASEDPLITEAEKLFGKEFVEVYED